MWYLKKKVLLNVTHNTCAAVLEYPTELQSKSRVRSVLAWTADVSTEHFPSRTGEGDNTENLQQMPQNVEEAAQFDAVWKS